MSKGNIVVCVRRLTSLEVIVSYFLVFTVEVMYSLN